jgi:hypothetical protein
MPNSRRKGDPRGRSSTRHWKVDGTRVAVATNEIDGPSRQGSSPPRGVRGHAAARDPVWVASYTDSATCKAVAPFGSRLP